MKVLHTITSMNPELGGVTEFVNKIIPPLLDNGIQCEIACMDDPSDSWLQNIPCKVYALGHGKKTYSHSKLYFNWLKQNINNYDTAIINGLWQYHGLATHKACIQNNKPYYIFSHGMLDPWFKKKYPKKHLKKLIYWLIFEKNIINHAAGIIFTCEEERLLARQSFPFYHPKEFVSAFGTLRGEYSFEKAMTAFTSKYPSVRNSKLILFMGRIHEKKGCDLLLEAFAHLNDRPSNLKLFIAGPDTGEYAVSLKKKAFVLGIADKVIWGGMIKDAVKWGAYNFADVFCLPSHQENFGIVVAEALSTGTAVIISNKVNIWREIEASDAGLICDDEIDSLRATLQTWLEFSDETRTAMREKATVCFDNHFDINKTSHSLAEILYLIDN